MIFKKNFRTVTLKLFSNKYELHDGYSFMHQSLGLKSSSSMIFSCAIQNFIYM